MRRARTLATMGCLAAIAASASAQQNTTIQLPTFNFTTVSTTVSVPDGGTGLLGGISRAAEGSVTRGVPMLNKIPGVSRLFKNQAIGREVGLSNMTIVPRIIVQEEEEFLQTGISSELLQGTAAGRPMLDLGAPLQLNTVRSELAQKAAFLSNHLARHAAPAQAAEAQQPAPPSVEEIRRRNELVLAERATEAAVYFSKGQQAETEGKLGVAKVYYQMAARRAQGDLGSQIAARLAVLEGTKQGLRLAER